MLQKYKKKNKRKWYKFLKQYLHGSLIETKVSSYPWNNIHSKCTEHTTVKLNCISSKVSTSLIKTKTLGAYTVIPKFLSPDETCFTIPSKLLVLRIYSTRNEFHCHDQSATTTKRPLSKPIFPSRFDDLRGRAHFALSISLNEHANSSGESSFYFNSPRPLRAYCFSRIP